MARAYTVVESRPKLILALFLPLSQASDNYFVKYLISNYLFSFQKRDDQCSSENKDFWRFSGKTSLMYYRLKENKHTRAWTQLMPW